MNTSSDKPQPAAISEKQPEIQPSFQPESNPAAKPDNLPENRSENKSENGFENRPERRRPATKPENLPENRPENGFENGFENRPERRRRRVALILVALFLVLSLCALLLFLFLRPADPRKPFPLTIDYPLERPYPLPAIVTPEQMADYYPLILDDSLLRVLATASWHPDGWRGLTLADGQYAYIDSTLLYSLPYLSARERHLRDSLIRREIATLHPSQRHILAPIACYTDPSRHTLYRLDQLPAPSASSSVPSFDTPAPLYRLTRYALPLRLNALPDLTLTGTAAPEGSAAQLTYTLTAPASNLPTLLIPYPTDTPTPLLYPTPDAAPLTLLPTPWPL